MSETTATRVCFQLQVKPEMLAEYRRNHLSVWPEMLQEIKASGRENYSLFLRDDGLLIGYYETTDEAAGTAYLASSAVAARWEAEMSPYFVALDGRADQGAPQLTEVFNLDEQLAALDPATTPPAGTTTSTTKE